MTNILKQSWWVLLLRGVAAIALALLLLFVPGVTLATGIFSFTLMFGVYALIDGVVSIVGALRHRDARWGLQLLLGVVGVVAGGVALANPLLFGALSTALVVLIVVFKAVAGGIVEIISAWRLWRELDDAWLLLLNGLVSLLFGLILIARPVSGVAVLVLIAAFYLLVSGVMLILFGFRVRGWSAKLSTAKAA